MTDVHSHILFNIDDGSYSIEESITLLKELKSIGFTDIILTPHYIKGSEYSANNQTKIERFSELKEEIKKQNIEIIKTKIIFFINIPFQIFKIMIVNSKN